MSEKLLDRTIPTRVRTTVRVEKVLCQDSQDGTSRDASIYEGQAL
jgi:hypothetical protein